MRVLRARFGATDPVGTKDAFAISARAPILACKGASSTRADLAINASILQLVIASNPYVMPLSIPGTSVKLSAVLLSGVLFAAIPQTVDAQPILGPPVEYRGCLAIDPTACGSFIFKGDEYTWSFFTWQFIANGMVYHVLEDFSYSTPDGACAGYTRIYAFWQPHCAIERRYEMNYYATVAWFDDEGQHRTGIIYSAVTPEPGTLALLASGLAGVSAMVRRRRKQRS